MSPWRTGASSYRRSRCGVYQRFDGFEFGRPRQLALAAARRPVARKSCHATAAAAGTRDSRKAIATSCTAARLVEHLRRRLRPDAGHQLQHAETRDAVARILDPAQHREHVLDVRGLEEFEPAEFHEGNVAPGQFDLQRRAVVRGAEQHGLRLERDARLALRQHFLAPRTRPGRSRRARSPVAAARPRSRSLHSALP